MLTNMKSSLTLYSTTKSAGVQIPYQTVTVHAQEGSAVLLGLNLSDPYADAEDMIFVQLRIVPTTTSTNGLQSSKDGNEAAQQTNGHTATPNSSQALFKAISDCQELNPDPPEAGDEEDGVNGGFDETEPGATGWITSENMADFMDENGNFRMPDGATVIGGNDGGDENNIGSLGEGAGRTRTVAEREEDEDGGAEDETKWQRTG